MLQTPPFKYAVRSFQFHLIKISQNKGNAGMMRYVCTLFMLFSSFFFSVALFVVGVICKLVDMITVILISYVFRPIHKMFKYV